MSLRHRRNLSALALGTLLSLPVQARNDPSTLCLSAAAEAAEATGVPYEVLLAIAVVETGRDDRPWPWTVNVAGDGRWFDTKEEAETEVRSLFDRP